MSSTSSQPSLLPSQSHPLQVFYLSGSLTGMLGDEQGNQTLTYTGLETLRPYFWLLHALCSHFPFCLVILLPSLPARFPSLSSESSLCSLFSSSSCLCFSLYRESGEHPGSRPVLLQPLLIHLSLAPSLSPSPPSLLTFIALLYWIPYISLSSFNSFSVLHIFLGSIHLPPSPFAHLNFSSSLVLL